MQQIARLQKDMGTDGQTGLAYIRVMKQGHGEMVQVPAGWMHLVMNLRPCAKMAWEIYKPEHFLNYVLSWQHVANQFTSSGNSQDYMSVMGVVSNVVSVVTSVNYKQN